MARPAFEYKTRRHACKLKTRVADFDTLSAEAFSIDQNSEKIIDPLAGGGGGLSPRIPHPHLGLPQPSGLRLRPFGPCSGVGPPR